MTTPTTFQAGDRVRVLPCSYDCSPAWVGTIVRYWRNGAWTIREDAFGTTVAIDGARLTLANRRLYVLAINWGAGWERHIVWHTFEATARRYFDQTTEGLGQPRALIYNGLILATANNNK
jgi:hypothetical protein